MESIKRIILTRTQLNEIMDNMKTNVTFTGSTPTEMGANAKQEYNDAIGSGLKSSAISFTGKSPRNNATDATEANIGINTNTPDIGKAVTDAVTNYVNNGGDINKVNVTGNAEDITNGATDESKIFSKRQIEEARLKKIHEGFKMTKRQMKENFVNEYTYGTYLEKGLSPEEIKKRQMEDDWAKIEEKPYMYDTSTDDYYNYNVFDDAFIASGRKKSGRLDAFGNDARVKRFNGTKNSARKIKESFDTDEQWKEEIEMFMRGLRMGDYEVFDDVLYVEIFKGQTAENDPRYAYIRKGENRLHDDHFYVQNSPVLSDTQLKDIYYNAGWEDILPELIDYEGFEMYESKNKIEINPKNKGKFTATKERTGKSTEELTHSKNPLTRKRANFAKMAKRNWKPLEK